MNSFRPGPVPPGITVQRPAWANLHAAGPLPQRPVAALAPAGSPAPPPGPTPEEILNEAKLQAAHILQDAAAQAEVAVEEASRQGFEAGRQEGLVAGQAEVEEIRQQAVATRSNAESQATLIRQAAEAQARAILAEAEAKAQALVAGAREQAADIVEEARSDRKRRLDEAQEAMVDLAVAAAMRLVHGHLALQPGAIVAMVAGGLRRLKDTDCAVRVSPQDLPLLEAQRSTLERELGAGLLRLQPDTGLAQGSYIAGSGQGTIDARLEQQAELMRTALTAALGGDGS